MKITRSQYSNLILLALMALLLFTPLRTHFQVWVNRLFAFSPSVKEAENRENVTDYNWELQSLQGSPFNLQEAKGKVIMLHFWATWCPSCIAELPGLQKLYSDYKDRVIFIFVSDESAEVITSFLAAKGYNLPVFKAKGAVPQPFVSKSIPATYCIDKKGDIVIAKSGAADWNSKKVRNLMDELLLD